MLFGLRRIIGIKDRSLINPCKNWFDRSFKFQHDL